MKKSSHLFLLPLFAILTVFNSGCSIFTSVGDAATGLYENTISYFNSYYNAKRAFDEAEDEIHTATLAARAKSLNQNQSLVVPVSAKQKLGVVIDKCSSILSFHPSSSLVDNALLLIGKSYFYQGEYVKAERKFLELNGQFPSSSLILESRLWQARTLGQSNRPDESIAILISLSADAETEGENETAAEAHLLLGTLYELQAEREKAVSQYVRAAELGAQDEVKTEAQFRVANLYFSMGQFEKAAVEYGAISQSASDPNISFQAKLQSAVSVGRIKEYDDALRMIEGLLQDFRFKDHSGEARLERARILHASGRREESLDEYRFLDTTYARTEIGSLASYELGSIFEKEFAVYAMARPYFARSAENKNTTVHESAQRKATALGGYLEAQRKLAYNDSVLSAHRTAGGLRAADSLSTTTTVNADSLKSVNATLSYDVGEIFYAELMEPDSAVSWYNRSLALNADSARTPRILFVLAELSNVHPERNFGNSGDYYRRLVNDYPDSKYADQARVILDLPKKLKETDPAEKLFAQAENLVESNQYEKAVGAFSAITEKFPRSPYAAKSEYAIGWLYEHRLSKPDSALSHYKRVVEHHASSPYAARAIPRIADSSAVRKDSVGTSRPKPSQEKQVKEDKEKESRLMKDDVPARARKKED